MATEYISMTEPLSVSARVIPRRLILIHIKDTAIAIHLKRTTSVLLCMTTEIESYIKKTYTDVMARFRQVIE